MALQYRGCNIEVLDPASHACRASNVVCGYSPLVGSIEGCVVIVKFGESIRKFNENELNYTFLIALVKGKNMI